MKLSTLLMAFILLFGCKKPDPKSDKASQSVEIEASECVSSIFLKDSVLGDIRNHASETISLSETIDNYTNDVLSLEYLNCPEKFSAAFHDHMEAWLDIKKVSDKYPSLRGELHDIFSDLEKSKDSTEFKSLVKQIWDTWKLVEEHSVQH